MGFATGVAPTAPADNFGAGLSRWRGLLVWLIPTLLTLAITAVQADRAQLWRDELATWSAATRPTPDLIRLVGHIDAVSGPYYLFMHGWIATFGDSTLALRTPSILAMTGAAGLTAVLGRRLSGPRCGLLAGLLFTVAPSTSRYAQEARSYALATLLAVLATLLLVSALDRPTWARWAGYAIALTGLGLAHLIALSLITGHAVAVPLGWQRTRDPRISRSLVAVVAVTLALTPLALVGRGQQAKQLGWVGTPGVGDLAALPGAVLQSGPVGGLLVGLAVLGAATGFRGLPAMAGERGRPAMAGERGRPAVAGDGRQAADRRGWGLVLGLSALLPTAVLFIGGQMSPLWVPRYLVCTVPFVCLLAAESLARIRLRMALPVVALAAFLGAPDQAGLRRTHDWPRSAPIDYRGASRIIAVNQRPGDGIVYAPRTGGKFLDTAIAYHLRDHRPHDVLATRDQLSRADLWATECDQPARCLASVNRVWLLVVGTRTDPLAGMPPAKAAALRDGFTMTRRWVISGLTVALLTRDSG